jgi:DNA-binding CsgD family transcriptional regulator
MCTLLVNPTLNLHTFLSLYRRSEKTQPFSESERQLKQLVMPHLWAAWASNWISQLASAKAHSFSSRVTLAVADQKGMLHAAEARFSDLMQREWPRWMGPELPADIRAGLGDERAVERSHLTTRVMTVSGLYLVEVRQRSPLDRLTPRELLIAERFGSGKSYKEIAAALPVSPATVRAHLRAIYSKLEISDKTELAALLSAHSDARTPSVYN